MLRRKHPRRIFHLSCIVKPWTSPSPTSIPQVEELPSCFCNTADRQHRSHPWPVASPQIGLACPGFLLRSCPKESAENGLLCRAKTGPTSTMPSVSINICRGAGKCMSDKVRQTSMLLVNRARVRLPSVRATSASAVDRDSCSSSGASVCQKTCY